MRPKKSADLNKRVTVQRYIETQDDYGEPIKVWEDIITVWAEIYPLRGREYFAAQQVQAEVSHRVTTRYIGTIHKTWSFYSDGQIIEADADEFINKPTWRILWGTRTFEIVSVIDVEERHRYLEFMCREAI